MNVEEIYRAGRLFSKEGFAAAENSQNIDLLLKALVAHKKNIKLYHDIYFLTLFLLLGSS